MTIDMDQDYHERFEKILHLCHSAQCKVKDKNLSGWDKAYYRTRLDVLLDILDALNYGYDAELKGYLDAVRDAGAILEGMKGLE